MQQYTLAAATTSVPAIPIYMYNNNNHLQVHHMTSATMATTHPRYIEGCNMISHNSTVSHSLNCIAVSNRHISSRNSTNRNRERMSSRNSSSTRNQCNKMKCSNSKQMMLDSSVEFEKWAIGWLRFEH